MSGAAFRAAFKPYMLVLGLHDTFHLRPYSIRRGGASLLFVKTSSYDVCCEVGRWSNVRTAKVYIDECNLDLARVHRTRTMKASIDVGLNALR